jgi:hypothetical protein
LAQRASRKRGRRGPPPPRTQPARAQPVRTQPARAQPAGAQPAAAEPALTEPRPNQLYAPPTDEELSRTQRRDAEARARLVPLGPGERPPVIVVSTLVAAGVALANLVAYVAGVKIGGKHPAADGIVLFSAVMIACAVGLWRMWYGAVLGFMALLAIVVTIFALLLIEASNVLGLVVALLVILGAGYLFYKLVRVLSRIQMPQRPSA